MRYLKIDEPDYWVNPERLERMGRVKDLVPKDSNPRLLEMMAKARSTHFVLGDPSDDEQPAALVLQIPPGYGLPYHAHSCDIVMIVIAGSLYTPAGVLGPGDCQQAAAHEFYGPEVAGPDGCTRVEFFAALRGSTSVLYMRDNGEPLAADGMSDEVPNLRGIRFRGGPGSPEFTELVARVRADAERAGAR
jgi:hypothetical protein